MSEDVVTVTKHADRGQFEIAVDGQHAGLTQYTEDAKHRTFVHTEIDDAFAGQGLAGILVRQALDATRADGLRIAATCPYVVKFLTKNHDWDDIVDAPGSGD